MAARKTHLSKSKKTPKERDEINWANFQDPAGLVLEAGVAGIADMGPTGGVGLPEIALPEELELDDMERRELMVNPSDLQDPGDPESGDVGVVGGVAAGGDIPDISPMSWGTVSEHEAIGMGGTGTIEGEMAEHEDEGLEEEKL